MAKDTDENFPTTRWTLVARLRSGDTEVARRALEDLVAQYRYSLYVYARRRGFPHHDAEDALHDFLLRLLRARALEAVQAEQGRLRGFLGAALGRYLTNWRRDAIVRGRHDDLAGLREPDTPYEERYAKERFSDEETAERIFERQWGQALMGRVMVRLRERCQQRGRGEVFSALRPAILAGGSLRGLDAAAMAARAGLSEGGLRVALNRHLQDYRTILEEEVLQTVERPEDVQGEIAHLMAVFASA